MHKIIKYILHDKLKWGFPVYPVEVDDMYPPNPYPQYKCKYCNNLISQDSQGNWFHLTDDKY